MGTHVHSTDTPVESDVPVWVTDHWEYQPAAVITANGVGGTGTAVDPIVALTSGEWGVGPLGGRGSNDLIGRVTYIDSVGQLRVEPLVLTPEAYGAVGDGVADDTDAVRQAFTAANAERRPGVTPTIWHPGATVVLDGIYNLATLATLIDVSCNVRGSTATLLAPSAYAGTVLRVGHDVSGSILQNADITLPDVTKAGPPTSLTAGSVGVQVQNLNGSRLGFGRAAYFENDLHFTGLGNGTAYNEISLGTISYAKVSIKLSPGAGGWVNQNTFIGGSIQQSPGYDGGGYRRAGWKHLQMDGAGINGINGNTFVGVSFEGDVSATCIDIRQATQNTFYGCRFEPGRVGRAVSTAAASTTVTLTAHGLVTGDMIVVGGTMPAELKVNMPYWVTSTPTADTFTLAVAKGGTAITFAAATSTALLTQPHRVNVDAASYSSGEIHFIDSASTQKTLDIAVQGSMVEGITESTHNQQTLDPYQDADRPLFRARNRAGPAVVRPLFAAYPPAVNPHDDPSGWVAALSDRGVLFGAARAETGRIFNAGGTLYYRVPADTRSYELASCVRSPGLIAVTSLACAANTTTSVVVTLTGVSPRDHIVVTPDGAVPAGITIAHARCTAANSLSIAFGNLTAATITLSTSLQIVAFRRFL